MISQERFNLLLENFSKQEPVLVIGDIGVDKYTKGHVSRISPEAPVPVLEVFQEWNKLGLAANVSDNLQSLGIKTTICGVIGNDSNGNILEDLIEEQGLSTWGIVRCDDRMTTFKERVVTDLQQICRIDYETKDDLADETVERLLTRIKEFIEGHSAIILEDYGKGMFTKEFSEKIIKMAKEHGKMVAVDPSRTTDPVFYRGADLLKPNQVESELMAKALGYNEKNTDKISEILMEKLNLQKLIITLGSEGMAITDLSINAGKTKRIPTVAKEVFDVSGAGDTAISAIVGAISSGASLEVAAWFGFCASGVVVGKKGTALVNQTELREFYNELKH